MDMEDTRAKEQAEMQLESIKEMVERLDHARDCTGTVEDKHTGQNRDCTETRGDIEDADEYHDIEKAERAIEEDALEVSVRSDWHTPGDEDFSKPADFSILLCTGGPAVRIRGTLDGHQEPSTAQLEYQDWGTPWTRLTGLKSEDIDALLTYSRCFYFSD